MARPKTSRADRATTAERDDDLGRADADISDAEHAQLIRDLEARFRLEASWDREARRRLKAGPPRA
jgi:hypothetical protein